MCYYLNVQFKGQRINRTSCQHYTGCPTAAAAEHGHMVIRQKFMKQGNKNDPPARGSAGD